MVTFSNFSVVDVFVDCKLFITMSFLTKQERKLGVYNTLTKRKPGVRKTLIA